MFAEHLLLNIQCAALIPISKYHHLGISCILHQDLFISHGRVELAVWMAYQIPQDDLGQEPEKMICCMYLRLKPARNPNALAKQGQTPYRMYPPP
jgi:hypothetical protein